jgi:AraC family transcriptional regulator
MSRTSTTRLIARTRAFLHENYADPIKLVEVGEAVGASPAYLTAALRRVEGVPLHRYLMQMRLARAVVDLPNASDLTTLAIGLGFSSHSHLSAVFRRAFRCTPSDFRAALRNNSVDPRRRSGAKP